MKHLFTTAVVVGLLAAISGETRGQSLPPVNLGLTSFVDGLPPAGPGFYFQQYFQYFSAERFNDSDGDQLSAPGGVDVTLSLSQFIYQSDQELLLGGKWGIDVIVPLVYANLDSGGAPISENNAGLGDILVGPFLQWDPIIRDGRPIFAHRIELQMIFPTGEYSDRDAVNPGSNFFSFNPYWSATYFPAPRWELSTRIHYLWNDQNDDPLVGDDAQAGQAVHLNFAGSYELLEKRLRVGVNGYYLTQITEAEVNGQEIDDSKERVLGIGPGALYSFSKDNHLFFNLYFETLTENRPEGWRAVLRWVHHF